MPPASQARPPTADAQYRPLRQGFVNVAINMNSLLSYHSPAGIQALLTASYSDLAGPRFAWLRASRAPSRLACGIGNLPEKRMTHPIGHDVRFEGIPVHASESTRPGLALGPSSAPGHTRCGPPGRRAVPGGPRRRWTPCASWWRTSRQIPGEDVLPAIVAPTEDADRMSGAEADRAARPRLGEPRPGIVRTTRQAAPRPRRR